MNSPADVHPFSLPRYPSDQPTQRAAHLLLVTQDDGRTRHEALLADIDQAATRLTHLALPEQGDLEELRQALAELLGAGQVGLQLELHGDEAFIWSLRCVAREAGLLADEILLHCSEPGRRLLFCVHCSTLQPGSDANLQPCSHCGVMLEVRRHFSERLGAYLGVCADADQPYAQGRP